MLLNVYLSDDEAFVALPPRALQPWPWPRPDRIWLTLKILNGGGGGGSERQN